MPFLWRVFLRLVLVQHDFLALGTSDCHPLVVTVRPDWLNSIGLFLSNRLFAVSNEWSNCAITNREQCSVGMTARVVFALTAMALHKSALTFKLVSYVAAIASAFAVLVSQMIVGHCRSFLHYVVANADYLLSCYLFNLWSYQLVIWRGLWKAFLGL